MIRCPSGLKKYGKKVWKNIQREYSIEDAAGLLLLKTIAETEDEIREIKAILAEEGRTKGNRGHPLNSVLRDTRNIQKSAVKMLNLDILETGPVGRPPGS